MEHLGPRLRRRRTELGLGLREMARKMGISPPHTVSLEKDKKPPFREVSVAKVAEGYDLDIVEVRRLALFTKYLKEAESEGLGEAKQQLALQWIAVWLDLAPTGLSELAVVLQEGTSITHPLGVRLQQRRADLGLTQPEVAERLGLERAGRQYVSAYELGRRVPQSKVTIGRIAAAYELRAEEVRALAGYSRSVRDLDSKGIDIVRRHLGDRLQLRWPDLTSETIALVRAVMEEDRRSREGAAADA